jgi:hypothetical protein
MRGGSSENIGRQRRFRQSLCRTAVRVLFPNLTRAELTNVRLKRGHQWETPSDEQRMTAVRSLDVRSLTATAQVGRARSRTASEHRVQERGQSK